LDGRSPDRDGVPEPSVERGSREDDFYIQNFGCTNRRYIGSGGSFLRCFWSVSGRLKAGQRAAPELAEDITERHIVSPYLRL
jgi:hypothetical protein